MWIFLPGGMVSCVRHTQKPDTVLVRARTRGHIENFIGSGCADLVYTIDTADYKYRADVSQEMFNKRLIHHASQISYPDFKGSIPYGSEFAGYHTACTNVWHVMNDAAEKGVL